MGETRRCPYCAEEIAGEAIRCRHCRSRLSMVDPRGWHRDQRGRRIAGVSVAVARSLALPVGAVRAAFVIATFFQMIGPIVYLALWLTIPFRAEGDSLLDRLIAETRALVTRFGDGPGGAEDTPWNGPR